MEKKVLVIIDKLKSGGAQKIAINLAINLKNIYGLDVKIVTFGDNLNIHNIDGVKIINLECGTSTNKITKIVNLVNRIIKLKKIKKNLNITHSISFLTVPNFVNVMSKQNDKIIISIRNEMSKNEKDIFNTVMHKIEIRKSDKVVAVSKCVLKDEIINYNLKKEKARVIYNFCDVEKVVALSKEKISEKLEEKIRGKKVIINIGRLEKQKGQDYLLKAFKKVLNKIPNAFLIILGKGSLEEELKNEIKKLNLENNVEIIGYVENPYKYIRISNCLVLSSLYEGFPNVILEAFAIGKPVISTYCNSGIVEVLTENAVDTVDKLVEKEVIYEKYGIITKKINLKKPNEGINALSNGIFCLLSDDNLIKNYMKKSKEANLLFDKFDIIAKWYELLD